DVGGIRRALVDQTITAVTTFRVAPIAHRTLLILGAVVLSPANHLITIGWMHGNAFKLQSVKRGTVQVRPGSAGGGTRTSLPDAAIVTSVDISRSVIRKHMRIGMKSQLIC